MMGLGIDATVVGGGSFGTALAHVMAAQGHHVMLWVRRAEQATEINDLHRNTSYLPNVALAPTLRATTELDAAVHGAPVVLVSVPSRSFRGVARAMGEYITGDQIVVHTTKGLELHTAKRMSEILREETCALKLGVLSGPTLADEIAQGHPAGAVVASRYQEVVQSVQALYAGSCLRTYGGNDPVGTELGGAFKNIIALAAGVVDGLGLGDNTKALLLTRGLSEMARFGVSMGGKVFTFGGLAGIGDLIATCASPLSRNHHVGERVGKGERLHEVLASMTHVAEGVPTTEAVYEEAQRKHLALPIVEAVYQVLTQERPALEAVATLMRLPVADELAQLRFD